MALIFVLSGFGKLAAPAATQAYIAAHGLPAPLLAYLASTLVEVVGGVFLIIGFQTRITAAVLAVYTLVAALIFHSHFADQNQMIHFMKNIAMTGGFLQVVAFGAGAFSVDNRKASPRASAVAHA